MANSKLTAELKADPENIGYADKTPAEVLTLLRVKDRDRVVESITGHDLFEASVPKDRGSFTDAHRTLFQSLIGMDTIRLSAPNTKASLLALFPVETETHANLVTAGTEKVNRAEELGLGHVREGHVQRTRAK